MGLQDTLYNKDVEKHPVERMEERKCMHGDKKEASDTTDKVKIS